MPKKFKTHKLESNIIGIIDIGSYKIRIAICEYGPDNIKLLSFAEKRQSRLDINNNEISNLEGVCENIAIAVKKAESIAGLKIDKIILNPVFGNTFFYSKKISHKRNNEYKLIEKNELFSIIKKIEKISYISATKNIYDNYLYPSSDLEIIVSHISEIKVDGKNKKSLLKENGKIINFNLLNIFLSKNNIELLNYIAKYLKKDLIKILPEEFCLSKIWDKKKEVVIIDFGNSSSYITVKDNSGNIFGSIKIPIGINSLIEKISDKSSFSRIEIIKKLNRDDFFQKEKKDFLDIYVFLLKQGLYEIMGDEITPNNFFIIGGGSNNSFLKKFIEKYDFSDKLKINKKIKFIIPNITKIGKIDKIETILNKSNLNIIAMILTYKDILNHNEDEIEANIYKAIKEIIDNN